MQLRCKCGYFENVTIHKDGLEAVSFTCKTCVSNRLKPMMIAIRVSSTRIMVFPRAVNMEGKPNEVSRIQRR